MPDDRECVMQKVIVIGCPGSGKSTFSRALSQATGLPLTHLDRLYWNPDKTTVGRAVFLERLSPILQGDRWIIDGNYAATMELRMQVCDTVIFLDYPVDVCLDGVRQRMGKPRSDMPWTEEEDDPEFIRFIENFQKEGRSQILELVKKYPRKTCLIFTDRNQADDFLARQKTSR